MNWLLQFLLSYVAKTDAPVINGVSESPLEVRNGDESNLECEQTSVASPLTTLTWYRQLPSGDPELLTYLTDVTINDTVPLIYTFANDDHSAELYCEATQPDSVHGTPVSSDRVRISVSGKVVPRLSF